MNITQNAVSFIITGTNFNTRAGANLVYLSSGTAKVTAQTSTQLTITFLTQPNLGPLYAVIKNPRKKSTKVRVATVVAGIVVTPNSDYLAINAPTLVIAGSGFSATANQNTVTFNLGAVGTVTSATTTELTVTFSTQPTSTGSLTAVVAVSTSNGNSGSPVEVANVYLKTFTLLIQSYIDDVLEYSISHGMRQIGYYNQKPFFSTALGFPSLFWDGSQWLINSAYSYAAPMFLSNSTNTFLPASAGWVYYEANQPSRNDVVTITFETIEGLSDVAITGSICVSGNSGYNNPSFDGQYYSLDGGETYRNILAGGLTLNRLIPNYNFYDFISNYVTLYRGATNSITSYYEPYDPDNYWNEGFGPEYPAPTVTMGEC